MPNDTIVCSNCGAPFHGITPCPQDAPNFTKTQEHLLARAAELQSEFWSALSDLEAALGFDVSGDLDLENETIEHLRELAEEEN